MINKYALYAELYRKIVDGENVVPASRQEAFDLALVMKLSGIASDTPSVSDTNILSKYEKLYLAILNGEKVTPTSKDEAYKLAIIENHGTGGSGTGGTVNLSNYYKKKEVDDLLDDKAEIISLTKAEYDALTTKDPDVYYVITDDGGDIDLSNMHSHTNKSVLDKFSEDSNGKPLYNGSAISGGSSSSGGRDFTTNPINLTSEVIGVLPDANISTTVARTSNVYNKTETDTKLALKANAADVYTKTETNTYVAKQIANIDKLTRKIVASLPTDADADDKTIYMLKVTGASGDKFEMYMKIDGIVQLVGTSTIDLSDYAKTADLKTVIENSHKHTNATNLDKISEDANGNPLYNGYALAATSVADNYSTQETVIGTWINGKPLYRKTIVTTTPSTANSIISVAVIDNVIDCVVHIYGYIESNNSNKPCMPLTYYYPDSTGYSYTWARVGNIHDVAMRVGTTSVSLPVYITIEYTKSTD